MTENSNNKQAARGFAGFDAYVSDVDAIIERCMGAGSGRQPTKSARRNSQAQHRVQPSISPPEAGHEQQQFRSPYLSLELKKAQERANRKSPLIPVLIGGFALVAIGALLYVAAPYLQDQEPGLQSTKYQSQPSANIEEMVPLEQSGQMLNEGEIRYCIAQGIRLRSANALRGMLSPESLGDLKMLFADYDARCGEYSYEDGAFERARVYVEARTEQYAEEGAGLFPAALPEQRIAEAEDWRAAQGNNVNVVVETPPEPPKPRYKPQPRKYVKDVQWRLYKLKFYPGPINGVDSAATQNALRGFFSVHRPAPDMSDEKAVFDALDKVYKGLK